MDTSAMAVSYNGKSDAMAAGVLHGRRDVRVEDRPRPAPGSGEVLLRVRRAGICGSDIHYFSHGYCGGFVPTRPFVLGHEFVAIVVAAGGGVESPAVGERVVVNPAASCGHCEACRAGRGNLCQQVVMLGSASTDPPTDGAFAEYVVTPARQCYGVPECLTDEDATLLEPLAVALHAVNRAGGVAGKRALICGGGPIGLLTARAARSLGAAMAAISEPAEARRRLALESADGVLDPTAAEYVKDAIAVSDGGFDVVFEASGAAAAVRSGIDVLRRGGTLVQIGTVGRGEVALPVNDIMVREISLLGTFRYADEFSQAIRLVAGGRIDLGGLVTATHTLAELPGALEIASDPAAGMKVHVTMPGEG